MIRALAQYFSGGVVPPNPGAVRAMEYGGRYADNGNKNGGEVGGPFASAQAQIEEKLSPLKGDLMYKIQNDPEKMKWAQENLPGGLEGATVYQLSQAADPDHSATQTNRLSRLARQANLDLPTETSNLYSRMNSGKFDVGTMDKAMLERGYEGEAGDIFSKGVAEGKIPLGAMISADTKDLGSIDDAGKFNFKSFDVPSGAEFLDTNKRRIKKDGSIRGDNQDDLTWHAQLGRGDRRTVSPDAEDTTPRPPLDQLDHEIFVEEDPGDPVAALRRRGPGNLPLNRPQPELQGGMRPLKDPEPTKPEGLGRFNLDIDIPNPSDYTGTEAMGASGPGAGQTELDKRMRATQLFDMMRSKGGLMYMNGGKMYGMGGGVRPIKNYLRGGKY